jgi:predicted TIM-barrel fold metal-dependent hydrolase
MIFDVNAWVGSWPFRALRDNTPDNLVVRMQNAGVDAAAVSQIDAILYRNVQSANERLAESIQGYEQVLIPMATINPNYIHWETDLRICHEQFGMRGVRLFPEYHGYPIDGQLAHKVAAACRERTLPIVIPQRIEDFRGRHTIDPGRGVSLGQIANLVAGSPGTVIIVTNARSIAGSPLWRRPELRTASWYVDLSLAEVQYQLHTDMRNSRDLGLMLEDGGAAHLLFGSHVPFSYLGSALVKLATLPVDTEALADISYRSAARLFSWTLSKAKQNR